MIGMRKTIMSNLCTATYVHTAHDDGLVTLLHHNNYINI